MTKITNGTNGCSNRDSPRSSTQLLALLNATDSSSISTELERAQLVTAARNFLARTQSPWETIRRHLVDSPAVQTSLKVCMDLCLFQKWKDSECVTKTASELAKMTNSDEHLLHRFLRHLVTEHLLDEVSPNIYVQTPFTLSLCEPHFGAWPQYMDEIVLDVFRTLPRILAKRGYNNDSLSTNDGAFQAAHNLPGKSVFEYFAMYPDRARTFNHAMTGYGAEQLGWLDIYPSSELMKGIEDGPILTDIGGNIGHDVEKFRIKYPEMASRIILQDQPAVVENAICKEDIQRMPHDFFTPQPVGGARAYYLHSVLHDWLDADALQILLNLRPAMKKGYSKLLINENVVLDKVSKCSPQITSFDLAIMGICAAQERTEPMWRTLLKQAGFNVVKIWTSEVTVESIIEAEVD